MTALSAPCYKGFRFRQEIISPAVWLYHRFSLSFRDIEGLLAARGVTVTYETVRQRCPKFGQRYAKRVRRKRARPDDTWHPGEVFLKIDGKRHNLWRAVDQQGTVLDILVESRRNKGTAGRFFRKLLKGCGYVPRVVITDKLGSYGAAEDEVLPNVEHRQSCSFNNLANNSQQPTRKRERVMQTFTSSGHVQRFPFAFGPIRDHFSPLRHHMKPEEYRAERPHRSRLWAELIGVGGR